MKNASSRLKITVLAFLAAFALVPVLASLAAQPALAQNAKVVRAAWVYGCIKALKGIEICQVERTVPGAGGKGVLMKVVIVKAQGVAKTFARFVVPLAVDLPSGVTYAVTKGGKKGKPITAPFKTCLRKGCIAAFALDNALANAMKAGKKLDIMFRMRDMKEVGVSIDLKGFSIVHAKLMAK